MSKRLAMIAAVLALLCGCDPESPERHRPAKGELYIGLPEVTYDGCQYLQYSSGYTLTLVHKGNCTNHPAPVVQVVWPSYSGQVIFSGPVSMGLDELLRESSKPLEQRKGYVPCAGGVR